MSKASRFNKKISRLMGTKISAYTNRRTFASVSDPAGLGFLTVKRMLNHIFQGGVTGGYMHQGFNPEKGREHFQKVGVSIFDCRAEY